LPAPLTQTKKSSNNWLYSWRSHSIQTRISSFKIKRLIFYDIKITKPKLYIFNLAVKNIMNIKLIIIICIIINFNAKITAQAPIIDSTVCITVGNLAQINVINNALSIPIGNSGVNQTYDYSVLPNFTSNYEILGVDNLTSPFGTSFPSANATVSWSSFGTPYHHFLLSDTSYIYVGGGGTFGDYQYIDDYKQLQFPFTYNDSYTDTFVAISNTGSYRAGSFTVSADGYGTLLVPGQSINDVLRVKRVSAYRDTTNGNPRFTEETYYEYYKNGIAHYILLHGFYTITTGTSNPVSGSQLFFNSGVLISATNNTSQSLSKIKLVKQGNQYQLLINTQGTYNTNINLFNSIGQLVAQKSASISNEVASIVLPTAHLSNGIYIVQLNDSNGTTVALKCNIFEAKD